ncbi:hypothetical protein G9A89_013213 [Geosiphon pyriformis]|nr:hypothetical protein G9A89_013213 [Geosiphon pyriformis]
MVKGHSGVYGNVKADFAAGAATRSQTCLDLFVMPIGSQLEVDIVNVEFQDSFQELQDSRNFRISNEGLQDSRIPGFFSTESQDFRNSRIPVVKNREIEESQLCIILQKTSTDNTKPKVAELETIGANHLGFTKSLFQHYCQYLGLNHNHISTKSAFNFYVNEKIFSLLRTPVNTESARETFYKKLIQNTNLPTNYNFTSIITEINKEIKHHIQQRYPITYASKGKGKLQTPVVMPRKIQPPAWKKNRVESPSNPSYHYTPGSAINISSTDTFTSTATSAFGQFLFQSRQRKTELLGPYDEYFEGFNSRLSTPSGL